MSPSDSSSSVLEEGNNDVDEENDEVEALAFANDLVVFIPFFYARYTSEFLRRPKYGNNKYYYES